MGLDISFYRQKKGEKPELIEVAYFRKHNWLLPFFEYGQNCSDKVIEKDELEHFIETARQVLEASPDKRIEVAKEVLPTEAGFFFGDTEYDDYYFECLKKEIEAFEEILEETDFETYEIIMNCWW